MTLKLKNSVCLFHYMFVCLFHYMFVFIICFIICLFVSLYVCLFNSLYMCRCPSLPPPLLALLLPSSLPKSPSKSPRNLIQLSQAPFLKPFLTPSSQPWHPLPPSQPRHPLPPSHAGQRLPPPASPLPHPLGVALWRCPCQGTVALWSCWSTRTTPMALSAMGRWSDCAPSGDSVSCRPSRTVSPGTLLGLSGGSVCSELTSCRWVGGLEFCLNFGLEFCLNFGILVWNFAWILVFWFGILLEFWFGILLENDTNARNLPWRRFRTFLTPSTRTTVRMENS